MRAPLKGTCGIGISEADGLEDAAACLCFFEETPLNVGPRYLKAGDRLTIRGKDDPSAVLWSGALAVKLHALHAELVWMEPYDVIFAPPPGVEAAAWLDWFREGYPAELVPAP